jgi:hypothetical protein
VLPKAGFPIDSRLLSRLDKAGFYSSVGTIERATEVPDANGAIKSTWASVSGMVNLPCTFGPTGGNEPKQPTGTYDIATHRAVFVGVYAIQGKDRLSIDGVKYDILSIENDSHSKMTHIDVRIVI